MPLESDRDRARRRDAVLAATEPVRAAASLATLLAAAPLLRSAPRGTPHPVLVLPGLLATDASTGLMRVWLRRLGYPVVGWELGRNRGPTQEVVDALPALVERLHRRHDAPVSIVGQSLGGVYARRLALRAPRHVRQVVSLGSPFGLVSRRIDQTPGARVYQRYAPLHTRSRIASTDAARRPLPVPSTSIYSRWDGVVDWRACLQEPGPSSENVGVHSSHLGMGLDPAVLWIVADRLAQPLGTWRPFQRPTRFGLAALFPKDDPADG